jgi:Undecaprenyl-phosphate glucose phosphotransferase
VIKENQKHLNRIVVCLDVLSIVISLLCAWFVRFKSGLMHIEGAYLPLEMYLKPSVILIPLYLSIYNLFKLYIPHRIRSIFDEFSNIIKSNVIGLLIFTLILYLTKQVHYSRYFLFLFGIFCTIITTLERASIRVMLRRIRRKGLNLKHIILIGFGDSTLEFLGKIHSNKHWGYHVVGILDDKLGKKVSDNYKCINKSLEIDKLVDEAREQAAASIESLNLGEKNSKLLNSTKVIGKLSDLERVLNKSDIDEVFITLSIKEYDKLASIINICEKCGVRTQIIPDYYRYIPAKPYVEEIEGLPIINIRYVPLDNLVNKFIKRIFDIIVSMICLIVFSPVMLLTTLIIKITSPGPILFKQERVGLNRKNFHMYKFRSMKVQKKEEEKVRWTTKDDPRKTRFGNFIRKTSIDELPQILNVLKGDMSLIGPRPERPYFVDKFKEEIPKYMVKHQVRPGMTGWAQVNGLRGDTSISKRIEHDIYYIENWSLSLDVKIMWLTVFKGFVNKNAY